MSRRGERASLGAWARARVLAEEGGSLSSRARARRSDELRRRFPDLSELRVIDLGGTTWSWRTAPVHPKSLLIVNVDAESLQEPASWMDTLEADVCALPAHVVGDHFDLAYSNSVIEHVGGHLRRRAFADAVHRLSPHHWVQTPARSFPLEPHWLFPGFQFLPVSVRARVSRKWPFGPAGFQGRTKEESVDDVLGIELVSLVEMRRLYPGSEIFKERVAGLTKSLVAVA